MLRKVKKLWAILKYFFTDEDNLFLHLMEMKAYEAMQDCAVLDVGTTEELEDLVFHIRSYYDIPENIAATKYSSMQDIFDVPKMMKDFTSGKLDTEDLIRYADFIGDVEKQRAVERDMIFEHAKALTFDFKL